MADQIPRVPIQTPFLDEQSNLTRPWILFLEDLAKAKPDPAPLVSQPEGWVNVKTAGAKGDAKRLRVSITAGLPTITAVGGGLTGLTGKKIAISYGAFGENGITTSGGRFKTTIQSVQSDASATLAEAAPATYDASDPDLTWANAIAGTDDSAAIQASIANGAVIYFPEGKYLLWTDGIQIPPWFAGVRLVGLSNTSTWLCYAGDGAAVKIGDGTSNTHHHGISDMQVDITCAGPDASALYFTPTHYCHMLHCRLNSQALFPLATMQQIGLVLDGGGYQNSFGANFFWQSNVIKGRFRRAVHMRADLAGWGYNACLFSHGTIIWESLVPTSATPPAGSDYIGWHMEQGNQNVVMLVDAEHWVEGYLIEAYDNVFHSVRTEYCRTWAFRCAAERPGVTTGGTYARVIGSWCGNGFEDETGTSQLWASHNYDNVENHITNYAFLDTGLTINPSAYMTWDGASGSSGIFWRDDPGGPTTGQLGLFGDKRMNVFAGASALVEAGGAIGTGSSTLDLTVYPGQTIAVEPDGTAVGKQISVERALDGTLPLITTISSVASAPTTYAEGTISLQTVTTDVGDPPVPVTTTLIQGSGTAWNIAMNGKPITIGGEVYTFQFATPTRAFITPFYPYADATGVAYSIAYNNYSFGLADPAGETVSGVSVQYGTATQWATRIDRGVLVKAHGTISFQIASLVKAYIDASGLALYSGLRLHGNQGVVWDTLGGSAGLSWQQADPAGGEQIIHGLLVHSGTAVELRAGESRSDKDLVLEAAHEDAVIQLRVGGDAKLTVDKDGASGVFKSVISTGNSTFQNITASQWIKIEGDAPPYLITRNTDAGGSHAGGLDMGWNGARQWLFSSGVPAAENTAFALTEYTDDVFDGVRLMVFKGGNVVIGATTDDGVNTLQVTGDVKISGDLSLTGTMGALTLQSTSPFLTTRNTDAGGSKVGGLDMGWNGARQWLFSSGVPAAENTAFALTEYTDDVFDGVRLMVFKGGNVVIGATTDDGVNKLQVTGDVKITGDLEVTNFTMAPDPVFTGTVTARIAGTPGFIADNTHATDWGGGYQIYKEGLREWMMAVGIPNSTNANLTFVEYNAGVYKRPHLVIVRTADAAKTRVLIGTSTDDGVNTLQVTGDVKIAGQLAVTSMASLKLESASPYLITRNTDAGSKIGGLDMGWNGARQWLFSSGVPAAENTAFALTEYTDGAFQNVRLMVFKGGNVVIGATTDDGVHKLQVTGDSKIAGDLTLLRDAHDGAAPYLHFHKKGNPSGGEALTEWTTIGNVWWSGFDGTSYAVGAYMDVLARENWSGSAHGTSFRFGSTAVGSTACSLRWAISEYGNILIATGTDAGTGEVLQVAGSALVTGNIAVNGTATLGGLSLTSPLPVASGGTGANNAAGALANLGTDAALGIAPNTLIVIRSASQTSIAYKDWDGNNQTMTVMVTPTYGSLTVTATGRVSAYS